MNGLTSLSKNEVFHDYCSRIRRWTKSFEAARLKVFRTTTINEIVHTTTFWGATFTESFIDFMFPLDNDMNKKQPVFRFGKKQYYKQKKRNT